MRKSCDFVAIDQVLLIWSGKILFQRDLNWQMVVLSDDEVALIRALLTAVRAIQVQEIDKALVILAKGENRGTPPNPATRLD